MYTNPTPPNHLPPTCRALMCIATDQPLAVQTMPTPTAQPSSTVVRTLAVLIGHATPKHLADETGWMTLPTTFVPGLKAVGRIAAVGSDATILSPGQRVLLDAFIRGGDNPDVQIIWGLADLGSEASKKLIAGEGAWRDGEFADYAKAPLENCYALSEKLLLGSPADGGLAYKIAELTYIREQLVGYGGLRGIDVKPGETVIAAPAAGTYGRATVGVAPAIGAKVIAVGRSLDALHIIAAFHPRVKVMQLTGDVKEDTINLEMLGPIDAYIDIPPSSAANPTHIRSCIMAVKPYGRVLLIGSIGSDIPIPYAVAMLRNLTIRGQLIHEKEHVRRPSGSQKLGW